MRSVMAVVAMAGTLVGGAQHVLVAQTDRSRLPDVIDRLGLTATGAPMWLERLGAGAGVSSQLERLMLVNSEGETLLAVTGNERHVPGRADVTRLLSQTGADIVMIHNHPMGSGLSKTDLMKLIMPGVTAIAAIGHDGSVYVAAAGPRFGRYRFGRQYDLACGQVDGRLNFYLARPSDTPWRSAVPAVFTHVVASALERASVIEYRAFLASARQKTLTAISDPVGRTVAAAADAVSAEPRSPGQDLRLPVRCLSEN